MARFTETVNIQQAPTLQVDTSGLAATLDNFAQQQSQIHAQQTQERAFTAGRQAFEEGQQPEFKQERFFGSVGSKAYNEGLRASYVASLDRDNRERIAQITTENESNLKGFNDSVNAYQKSVLNNVDPSARQVISDSLDGLISSNRIKVQNNEIERVHRENNEETSAHVTAAVNDALGFARDGDDIAAAESAMTAFASIDGRERAGFISAEQAKGQKRAVERGMVEEKFIGGLLTLFDDKGERAAFAELDKLSSKRRKGFTPEEWDQLIVRAQSKLSRKRSRFNAERSRVDNEAKEALKDLEKANALGFNVNPSELQRVEQLVSSDPALKKRFDISNSVRAFSVMPAVDRGALLAKTQTGDLGDVDQLSAMTAANNQIDKLARQDGLKLAFDQGVIDQTDLSLGDAEEFSTRMEQAKAASKHYGVPVSPLTSAEADGISDNLPEMTTDEKIQLALTFQESPDVWGQLSDRQATIFAMAGATGDVNLMSQVFKGQELIDAKLVKAISSTDYISDFNDIVEGVYGPQDSQGVLKAALAYYAQTSDHKDGEYSSSDFEEAINAVTGGIGEINGFKVELPRGVDEGELDDFIDGLQPETIEKLGGVAGIDSAQAAKLVKSGRLRNIKSGSYIVETDNGTLFKPDGTPFIIEWNNDLVSINESLEKSRIRSKVRGRK